VEQLPYRSVIAWQKASALAMAISALTDEAPFRRDMGLRDTFVIKGQDIKQEMRGSTSRRFEVTLPAGTYEFYCDVPGHSGVMKGVLTVK
jgi:hypothetical protein